MASSVIKLIPNVHSTIRLGLAAAFPFVPDEWRLPTLAFGAFTDWTDGVIARRYQATTSSGVLLDAIADKIFTLSVLVTLALSGEIMWWQIVLALARDLAVAGTAAWCTFILHRRDAFGRMRPRLPGKVTTTLVFAWLIVLLAGWPNELEWTLFVLAAVCSMIAAVDYLRAFVLTVRAEARA